MAKKDDLRNQREGTVINTTSKRQEKELDRALEAVCSRLLKKFPGITLKHDRQWFLKDVVASLSEAFPEVDFHYYHDTSFMKPDVVCLLYTSPSPRDRTRSRMPSSA